LVRTRRVLPRILEPGEVDALLAALRTDRDRAMVTAMLLGGCSLQVLGLTGDLHVAERRLFIAEGRAGISESCRSRHDSSPSSRPTRPGATGERRR
jgi:hypothetical protein